MSDLVIQSAEFDAALVRLISSSKRGAVEVMRQQAKLLFSEVAKVTPPAGGKSGNTLTGKAAEKAGKLAIVRDYHNIYGTPSSAYDDLKKASGQDRADAFWSDFKNDKLAAANAILRADLGKSFSPFDGGKAANQFRGKQRKREVLYYVQDAALIKTAITNAQQHVWYLAGGWKDALLDLGAKLPYGIAKGSGPGMLKVTADEQRIDIRMINLTSYAKAIKGLQAQINFAMKVRTGALQRGWDDYMKRLARETGLKAS